MKGKHDSCKNPESCLCASDHHGERISDIILQAARDSRYASPKDEPREYEQALRDEEELETLLETGVEYERDPEKKVMRIIELLITSKHLVSKIDIKRNLTEWNWSYVEKIDFDKIIDKVFANAETFKIIKKIAFENGRRNIDTIFENTQQQEVARYLIGKYHIKRIDVNGSMLFFTGKYYSDKAESLIRRSARKLLIKSKNGDMNEIVKMIEDTCDVITWNDVHDDSHVKCLLNGTYDTKRGVFSPTFSPERIILNQIPHNYVEGGCFIDIDSKVSEIISNPVDRQSYYDFLSTALQPYTGIDIQFGGVGKAGTGKSQLCELAIMVLGEDNVASSPIHSIAGDMTTQKDVAFKFLNIDMDMSNDTIKNIDVLKRWITQDKFTARGIYEHNTTFRPMARICFMANDLYDIANTDDAEAIFERTHLIQINNKFRGTDNVIRNLFRTVATDSQLDEFVSYLLRNAKWIWDTQKIHHPMHVRTVMNTWNLHGNRIKEFINKWIVKGIDNRVQHSEVWAKWLSFSNEMGYQSKDKKKFNAIFDEILGNSPSKTRINGEQVWAYTGFRLHTDSEMKEMESSPLFETSLDRLISRAPEAPTFFTLRNYFQKYRNKNKLEQKMMELLELMNEGVRDD